MTISHTAVVTIIIVLCMASYCLNVYIYAFGVIGIIDAEKHVCSIRTRILVSISTGNIYRNQIVSRRDIG